MADSPNGNGWDGTGWTGSDRADTHRGDVDAQYSGYGVPPYGTRPAVSAPRNGLLWALGALVVVLLVALAGVVGYLLAAGGDDQPVAAPPSHQEPKRPGGDGSPGGANAEEPAADAAPIPSSGRGDDLAGGPGAAPPSAVDRGVSSVAGDLGLAVPMTRPSCDGRGIVVLYSAVTPGAYAQEIASALAQNPGASYLRTDMACPSLRPRDENGNVIYAVYRPSGYSVQQLCSDVRAEGPPAYGRWLDTTSNPSELVSC